MKDILKIAVGIVSFFVIVMAGDYALGSWSESMYYKCTSGVFYRQIYCLTESQDDIIICGSSRAAHHYIPHIFEDSLGMSCYNAGSDGMCIYYHYGILTSRIQRGVPPKVCILDILNWDVEVKDGATFTLDAALDRLIPHYGEFEEIDYMFTLKDSYERLKLIFKTYKYNSKLVSILSGNYIDQSLDKGYSALYGVMELPMDGEVVDVLPVSSDEGLIDELKLSYLYKFISACNDNNIKLVMCYSPYYGQTIPASVCEIEKIAEDNGVIFLNYGEDIRFQKTEYFQDASHLNHTGASVYSREIAHILNMIR